MRLYVAMLRGGNDDVDTRQLRGLGKAIAQMMRLKDAVEEASRIIRDHANPLNGAYHALFVAPEYFFSNQQHLDARFFKHEVKRWIVEALKSCAGDYPHLVIIPGTVLWTKRARPSGDAPSTADVVRGNLRVAGVKQRYATTSDMVDRLRGHVAVRYAPERDDTAWIMDSQQNEQGWTHHGRWERWDNPLDRPAYEQDTHMPTYYLDSEPDTLIAQNTAYVLKGDRVLKYHKVGNSSEVSGEPGDVVFAPGSIVGQFTVGAVRYGLEICMDHWLGVLANSAIPPVHVHVITSSHTENRAFHYHVQSGGVVVHSSTNVAHDPYAQVGGPHKPLALMTWGTHNLQVFGFDLDDAALGVHGCRVDDALAGVNEEGLTQPMVRPLSGVRRSHPSMFDKTQFAEFGHM